MFFVSIAGTTFKQVRETLNNDPDLLHTTKDLSDAEIMKMLDHPELHPEGNSTQIPIISLPILPTCSY